jgi:drug/metabolite transporter (DMT)-like permease
MEGEVQMSQEVIAILEQSLVENTRMKRAQWIAFLTLLLASIGCLLWIGHLTGRPRSDIRELLMWSVIAILVFVCYGVTALAIYINGTTARLLRTMKSISEQM